MKVPHHVREFLVQHVDTIEKLEVLLGFAAAPRSCRSVLSVGQQLGLPTHSAESLLRGLAASGLVRASGPGEYVYDPSPAHRATVSALAELYATTAPAVLHVMSAASIARIRQMLGTL